jgi:hypothetical protein
MICRPKIPTLRVHSAVALLLFTMSSLLVAGAEWTTSGADAAFDRDVAFSPSPPPVEVNAKAAALAQSLDRRRAEEDADSSWSKRGHHRMLPYSDVLFTDSTTAAPVSAGNPATASCGGLTGCINGCRSRFYRVTGGIGNPITATTCYHSYFPQRLYVWKGTGSDCSTFTCTGT